MILSLGFSLNVEISGNMKNQRNPFPHKSEFVTNAKEDVLLTLRGQNASECKFQKQTIFFWMSGVSFRMFRGFYEKRIYPTGKRTFAISPDRIGEKSDPNLGLEWWTKYDYFARFKREACQTNTKKHRCKNKTMNISVGFSLRIEISGKDCVYHNLPWVFNSYVLLRERGGES